VARSTRRDERPGPESEGGRVVVALIVALALLAGGGYAAAYLAAGDKVPVGTRIGGVDIGGHTPATAMQVLRDGLAGRASTPFTVTVNGHVQQVPPEQAGLAVDYAASVHKAGADRSWRPSRLWTYFTDNASYAPVITLDQGRLATLIRRIDAADGRPAEDGSVVFRHATFTVRPPRTGLVVDPRAAGTAFWNAYLSDDPSVNLRMAATEPTIGAGAIRRFVRRFANPAMAASVELRFGQASLRLSPASYGHLLAARPVGHELRPTVRARALAQFTASQLSAADTNRPTPATVALIDGRPQVVRARPGVTFLPRDVGSALLRAIASPHRVARVHPTPAKASFTDADARGLGIRKQLASFTVHLPRGSHGAELVATASRLDGTVLKPGDALSLRGALGAGTPEGPGGDALATALFNAAWLGGLRVTAHATPVSHRRSVPVGRDASLRDGQDLAFTDNTGYGVLVSVVAAAPTATHRGSLTVVLWSTPRWTITSDHGDRTDVVPAGLHVGHGSTCSPRKGQDGYDVTVTRSFSRHGRVDHTSSYVAHYEPRAAVVCRD